MNGGPRLAAAAALAAAVTAAATAPAAVSSAVPPLELSIGAMQEHGAARLSFVLRAPKQLTSPFQTRRHPMQYDGSEKRSKTSGSNIASP